MERPRTVKRTLRPVRRVRLYALMAVLAVVLAACGDGSGPSADSDTSPQGEETSPTRTIKLGSPLPTSGRAASYGVSIETGTRAFLEAYAARDDSQFEIEYLVRDNGLDAQQNNQVSRTLIEEEDVVAMFNSFGSAAMDASFSYILDQQSTPIIFHIGGLASWYEDAHPLLWGAQALYEDQAVAVGRWMVEDGVRDILIVHSDPPSVEALADTLHSAAQESDDSVQVEKLAVPVGTTDYAPIAAQVNQRGPEAVAIFLDFNEAATFLEALELQGLDIPVYGYGAASDARLLELAGEAANGYRGVLTTKLPEGSAPEVQAYREALQEFSADQQPDDYSLVAYAQTAALVQVFEAIDGTVTVESIVSALSEVETIETGLLPPLNFQESQNGTVQVQRFEVVDGARQPIGDFYPPRS